MTGISFFSTPGALLFFLIHLAVIARVILRPHREPAARIAWIVMIIALPVVGMIFYLLLGETNIGRRRMRRRRDVLAGMPGFADARPGNPRFQPLTDEEVTGLVALMASWRETSVTDK